LIDIRQWLILCYGQAAPHGRRNQAFHGKVKGPDDEGEVDAVTGLIAVNPLRGDLIKGTGGVRKLRFAIEGRGKSGGVRVIYYFYNDSMPAFLVTVFAKKEKDNLTKAERNMLASVAQVLRDSYGE
jgi:hypothetical protein